MAISQLIIAAVSGGLCTLLGTVILWLRFAKKDKAETRKLDAGSESNLADAYQTRTEAEATIAGEWKSFAETLKQQVEANERKIAKLEERIQSDETRCNRKIDALRNDMETQMAKQCAAYEATINDLKKLLP